MSRMPGGQHSLFSQFWFQFWNQCADWNSSRVLPRRVESVGGVVSPEAKKRRRAFLAFRCDRVRSHCASRHHSVLPRRSALQDFVECEEGGKRFGRPPRSSRACVWHCVSSYEHLSSLMASSTPTFLKILPFFTPNVLVLTGGRCHLGEMHSCSSPRDLVMHLGTAGIQTRSCPRCVPNEGFVPSVKDNLTDWQCVTSMGGSQLGRD